MEQNPLRPAGLQEYQTVEDEFDPRHPNYRDPGDKKLYQQTFELEPEDKPSLDDPNIISQEGMQPQQPLSTDSAPNFLSEVGGVLAGGAADAVESVGGIADLTGDTLKKGLSYLTGKELDPTQDITHSDYERGTWLDVPDDWVPENKTALGKLARGFVEFGLLTAATGGVGSAAFGGARLGVRGLAVARSAGVGAKGTRFLKFIQKGTRIAAEGGAADLISTSSEDSNLANLVDEFAPWMPLSETLSVQDDDNPWLARIKTVTAGAGVNLVGWRIASYVKGRNAAKAEFNKLRKQGKSVDEAIEGANIEGNKVDADEYIRLANESEKASTQTAKDAYAAGKGIPHSDNRTEYIFGKLDEAEAKKFEELLTKNDPDSLQQRRMIEDIADARGVDENDIFDFEMGRAPSQADDALRQSDPKVNPENHLDVEKADIVVDKGGVKSAIKTSIQDLKAGGPGRSWKHMWTAYSLKKMGGKNARRLKILEKTRDEIVRKAFNAPDNTMSYPDMVRLTDKHISDSLEIIMDGGDMKTKFMKLFTEDPDNYRVFATDGEVIKTITPAQKAATQLALSMLADTATSISQAGVEMAGKVPIGTQYEQVMDAMKALMIEHKRFGLMWGLDGVGQQLDNIPENIIKTTKARLKQLDDENEALFDVLGSLRRDGRYREMAALLEVNSITGNKINTLEQVYDWINKSIYKGGSINGFNIDGMAGNQLKASWYNSILSSVRTPIKAIVGTNLISTLRPYQAWVGATLNGNKEEAMIAATMIDAIRHSWAESMDMFRYNWNAGVHKRAQSYDLRYDIGADLEQWKTVGETVQMVGSDSQKKAYAVVNGFVDFNTSKFVRYSTNAMGAGDAFARTMIGRMEMRMLAARKALEDGVDITDIKKVAQATEENFRNSIFKEGQDGKWIVHDKAAKMAGDEAAMTRQLEGVATVFDTLNKVPILKAFFPFARTGVNALNLTFEHVPVLARTQRKFRDIMSGDPERAAQWGIRPENIAQAQALQHGRLATGQALMGMTTMAALSGNMTGDYPYDKERRDLWRENKIPPYSIKVGDTWVSYRNIEPFNTVASMAANIVHNADVLGEDVTDQWFHKTMFMFAAVMVDKTMLSGVKDIFSVIDTEREDKGREFARVAASKVRPLIPMASMSKDIGNIIDAVQKEKTTFGEMLIQKDAITKSYLEPKYDFLSTDRSGKAFSMNYAEFQGNKGFLNPMLRIFNAISPITITAAEKIKVNGKWVDDPVKTTLQDMKFDLPSIMNTYKGVKLNSKQRSQLQYWLSKGDLRKKLERAIYPANSAVRKGLAEYKAGYIDNQGNHRKFTEAKGFKLGDREWYQIIRDIFNDELDYAMAKVMENDIDLKRAVESLKDRKAIQSLNRMQHEASSEISDFIGRQAVPTK